jgi:hypothetical protein
MKKILSTFTLVVAIVFSASAQSDMLLYNFNAISQSLHTNPAMPQQTKVWVGLPAISGFSTHYHNSGFSAVDIFEANTDINANLRNVTAGLDASSQLAVSQTVDLLGIGFSLKKGFVSLGATQHINLTMDIPYQLFEVMFSENNNSITQLDLSTFDLEISNRTAFYLGYQHRFLNEKLTLGVRANYLIGQQHAYIERSNISLTNDSTYTINGRSDILVRSAGASAFEADAIEPMNIAFADNTGFSFNFGGHYQLSDKWSFSASVLDIGSITYNDYTRSYVSDSEFEFRGIEADLAANDFGDAVDRAVDSLEAGFNFQEVDGDSYSRSLMPRIFAAANYHINEKHTFGALYHSRIWNGEAFHDFGVNYQGRLSRTFQFTAGYSMINGTAHNIGAGFDLKLGAFQLYLMSDNIFGMVDYGGLQTTNFRFGINLTFYGKKEKKEKKKKKANTDTPSQTNNESNNFINYF